MALRDTKVSTTSVMHPISDHPDMAAEGRTIDMGQIHADGTTEQISSLKLRAY